MTGHLVDNRYRTIRKLGEGGMGAVYLVDDLDQEGKRAALKIINAQSVTQEYANRFEEEFEGMTQLRHPNLAEVYDFGTIATDEGSQNYFTSEYVHGSDIFQATEESSWAEICELIVQTCRALAYLHSRGLIHYDIKPSNVLVTRQEPSDHPVVKLLDFGLSRPLGTKLMEGIYGWGTPHYVAPEMAKVESMDERVDLYSLGVVLYQAITRRLPFEGETALDVLKKHAGTPLPLSDLKKHVSDDQIQVVTKLLAKEPAARYSNAHEVIEAINDLGGPSFEIETRETKESYVLGGKLTGRESEIKRLKALSEGIRAGRERQKASLVFIHGESGIGKSRLLRELRYFGQLNHIPFFQGNCLENGGVIGQAFVDVLRQAISSLGAAPGSSIVAEYAPDLAKLLPPTYFFHVLETPPDVAPKHEQLGKQAGAEVLGDVGQTDRESLQLAPEQERLRLIDRITELLLRLADRKPMVIVIEDLHWGDELTIDLLHYLARNAFGSGLVDRQSQPKPGAAPSAISRPRTREGGILILATHRGEGLPHQIEKVIQEINREPYSLEMRLERLSSKSVEELLGTMLGTNELPNNLGERVLRCTGGNPFFIEEAMKSLVENDTLYVRDGRWRVTDEGVDLLEMPQSVTEALQRRLGGLDELRLRALKVMSVFGRPVTLDLLGKVSGIESQALSSNLAQLERRQIVTKQRHQQTDQIRQAQQESQYGFLHPEMWSMIYDTLSDDERQKLHDTIGNTLEELYHGSVDENLEELGHHFVNGTDKQKAVEYGIKAGDKLKSLYASDNAIELYEKVLDILPKRKPSAQEAPTSDVSRLTETVLLKLGEVYSFTGGYDKALENYKGVLSMRNASDSTTSPHKHCTEGGANAKINADVDDELLARVYQKMGNAYKMKGRYDEAIEILEKGRKLLENFDRSLERARIFGELGVVYFWKGQYGDATKFYQEGLRDLEEFGDNPYAGAIYNDLGIIYQYTCEYDLATKYSEMALEIRNRTGDLAGRARTLNNLGNISSVKGEYARAADYYQQSLEIKEKIGFVQGVSSSLNNLGLTHYQLGDYAAAKAYCEKSLEIKERIGDTSGMSLVFDNLGLVSRSRGRYSEAIQYFNRALDLYGETVGRRMIETSNSLGFLYVEIGRTKEAEELAYRGLEFSTKLRIRACEGISNRLVGQICASKGELDGALGCFEKALSISQEVEDKRETCLCNLEMAGLQIRRGDFTGALRLVEGALNIAEKVGSKDLMAQSLLLKGIAEGDATGGSEENGNREAIRLLQRASELAEEVHIPEVLWRSYYAIGVLQCREKRFKSALSCYEKCIGVFEVVCSNLNDETLKRSYLNSRNRVDVIRAINELRAEVD